MTMASDFAAMRRIVEQFAAKQQEMAQQIAALRTAKRKHPVEAAVMDLCA